MRSLSAQDVVKIWEIGQPQHPLDRALTLLTVACPELSPTAIAALSVGQRDAALLSLRELTFGSRLNSVARCPQCGEQLESSFSVADLRVMDMTQPQPQNYLCSMGAVEVQFRLPNSWDLAAIVGCRTVEAAKARLEERCIVQVKRDQVAIAYTDLPPEVRLQVSEQIGLCDPQAEILVNLVCPACKHEWRLLFDIVMFFWSELAAEAKRLLREVHTLARFYGWREADILAMSAMRRHLYLSMVGE